MATLRAPNLFVTEPIPSGRVKLKTTHGPIEIELWPKETPKACRNFVQLCLEGFYDGVIWHRIVPNFIVQTGDPTGTGSGGESIYDEGVFADEINARLKKALITLIHSLPITWSSCQPIIRSTLFRVFSKLISFELTIDRTEELQDKHTIFGSVIGDTIYNVLKLSEVEVDKNERPVHPPVIKSVEVIDNPFPDIVPRITTEQRKEQAKAKKEAKREKAKEKMKSKHKALAKNKGLLSFADEEQLTAPEIEDNEKRPKFRSAHDVDVSSQLSNKIIDQRPSAVEIPSSVLMGPPQSSAKQDHVDPDGNQPVKMHAALKAAVKRRSSGSHDDVATGEAGPSKESQKKRKEDVNQKSDADKVKAEIARMEAALKRGLSGDECGPEDGHSKKLQKPKQEKKTQHSGSLLEAERIRYKARAEGLTSRDTVPSKKGTSGSIELILEGFRSKLRGIEPLAKSNTNEADRLDGYAGEVDPTQDGVLGDVDGDDEGWMSHELKFRKDATVDQHRADEYSVVDPLANKKFTLNELAARKSEKRFNESRGQEPGRHSAMAKNPTDRGRDKAGRY
ncbi:hypothetical protein CROQUDRAFT_98947 [Cronartium quercuum f. sp. fusiforme G11]|uniref:PPIase cyclophilin-type domain-containing protein n=1 Tax=Cronartium quercuum f. sp. fusiforme G11 TaxID=708437 RepID=A0A9P6NCH7_9BASI|nr:hypothetical protein CROQUDRAFT_98947 [Cronartium quercuum f. sp. fusiforme G11]